MSRTYRKQYCYITTWGNVCEGENVVGVYSTLALARAHRPTDGDYQVLYRFKIDTADYREIFWASKSSGDTL